MNSGEESLQIERKHHTFVCFLAIVVKKVCLFSNSGEKSLQIERKRYMFVCLLAIVVKKVCFDH
ncbi:hypothetical protein [Vibrio marisflavi]|uniref:hypothetical protein n=1 Tax=Vibrio marisflavi TaxID=1216040 RepID=UPI001F18904B|nr:hypothetical protein [Vibrio marisflavi]